MNATLLTVQGAAEQLGVHANTVRAWTDQGLLTCLRINKRGDRRYRPEEIERLLARAKVAVQPTIGDATASEPPRRVRTLRSAVPDARVQAIVDEIARSCGEAESYGHLLSNVVVVLCAVGGYSGARLVDGPDGTTDLLGRVRGDSRVVAQVRATGRPYVAPPRDGQPEYRAALPLPLAVSPSPEAGHAPVLVLAGTSATRGPSEARLLTAVAAQLAAAWRMHERVDSAVEEQRRAELLLALTSDIGSHLDLPRVLDQLMERAAAVFAADHSAVFDRTPWGGVRARATRNLSPEFCHSVEHAAALPIATAAFDTREIVSVSDFPEDPRASELRVAMAREGINTVTLAPLLSDGEVLGALVLYHDRPYAWSPEQLTLLERLAAQAATTMRNAQNYSQMATWAAQLQSIQQLGARLTRLRTVREIGEGICAELHQLIAFHNVRVYRIAGDDCVPVAWRGEIGEYSDENDDQLRVRVGEGVTGWVARFGLAQNVGDAANDKRAMTIPGTDDDLDESLLLAPMLYEDEVLGVIVLAKLGLNQFSADDLRLLEIYASIAAQAMANADSTERLRAQSEALARQLNSQRELLRVTESILSTLDTQALLQEIAERLKSLVAVDNICVDIHDPRAGVLRPIFAHGVQASDYLRAVIPDDVGVGGYVLRTGEAQLVADQLADDRVVHFDDLGPEAGAMIVAPIRGSDCVRGVLTIERLGDDARFADEEFELVKLFAAHVSIALQNAEAHREVELRAETDALTGLWNHGALLDNLDELVARNSKFAMLMVDLDYFKRYNDRWGHQAGNAMLQRIAALLRGSCRETDRVFRYGGDEFALLLPGTSAAGARIVAEKVLAAVSSVDDGREMPMATGITCSIGVAVYPRDGHDSQSMILAADRACYAGKRGGRARLATAAEGLALAAEFEPTEPAHVQTLALARQATYSAA